MEERDIIWRALQRQNTEISKQIFPEKKYRGLSPNFHIHVSVRDFYSPRIGLQYRGLSPNLYIHASVRDLYIPTIGLPILLEEICRPTRSWDYKNRAQTHECGNWG
jgi:hypothetical protein